VSLNFCEDLLVKCCKGDNGRRRIVSLQMLKRADARLNPLAYVARQVAGVRGMVNLCTQDLVPMSTYQFVVSLMRCIVVCVVIQV